MNEEVFSFYFFEFLKSDEGMPFFLNKYFYINDAKVIYTSIRLKSIEPASNTFQDMYDLYNKWESLLNNINLVSHNGFNRAFQTAEKDRWE